MLQRSGRIGALRGGRGRGGTGTDLARTQGGLPPEPQRMNGDSLPGRRIGPEDRVSDESFTLYGSAGPRRFVGGAVGTGPSTSVPDQTSERPASLVQRTELLAGSGRVPVTSKPVAQPFCALG